MKQSESIAQLAAALAIAQQHIQPVTKDRQNPHFKNNYATLDAIMESVRGLLAGHGLAIVQGGGSPITDANGAVCGTSVETMLVHTSGEFITSAIVLPVERPSPQTIGSAITYGRRYGIAALLALTTEEDDDGNHAMATQHNAGGQGAARPTSTGNGTASVPPASAASRAPAAGAANAAPAPANGTAPVGGRGDEDVLCPKCGGRTWDNRLTKKNPKAPDYKCRDRACDGVVWPPKEDAAAPKADPKAKAAHSSGPHVPGLDDAPPHDDDDIPY